MAPHSSILAWNIPRTEEPLGLQSTRLQESNMTENTHTHIQWDDLGFPCGSAGKESACNAGDLGSIPGLERSPGEGKATHSSILAWRTPWTVQPMGS